MTDAPIIKRPYARCIEASWYLGEATEGYSRYAVLSATHLGAPQKCYRAVLQVEEHQLRDNGIRSQRLNLRNPPPRAAIDNEPTPRYSAKGLEAFFGAALAGVEEGRCAGDPDIAAVFAGRG